jgi:putative oxidoreductase
MGGGVASSVVRERAHERCLLDARPIAGVSAQDVRPGNRTVRMQGGGASGETARFAPGARPGGYLRRVDRTREDYIVLVDREDTTAGRATDTQAVLLSVLRAVVGFLFICHGVSKIFGVLGGSMGSGKAAQMGSLLGYSGIIEFAGGILLLVGLFTRATAVVIALEMAIAYLKVHIPRGPWPIMNRGELAVVYCFLLLYMASVGGGPWSLDRVIRQRRRPSESDTLAAARIPA